jgi:glycosyltransferase involved in cell wall biosynthesis
LELFIVDGMSDDNTRDIISDFFRLHPQINYRVIDNPSRIVSTGLNIALRQVTGQIIIRVDGHCIIASDYVRRCVEHIQHDGVDGVGGPMRTIGETPVSQAIAIGMSSLFGVGDSAFRVISGKSMLTDTIPFPAYTHQIIDRVGLYDEELVRNQDDEYNYRIREMGGKILLSADVHSTYYGRSSLLGLWRQYFQYGYWKVRVLQKHPHQMSLRQFVPPVFVIILLLSVLLAISIFFHFSPQILIVSTLIPIFYFIVNLLASVWTASTRGWKHLFLLPLIFFILHASYGYGFLIGFIKFWDRWSDKIGKVPEWTNESYR